MAKSDNTRPGAGELSTIIGPDASVEGTVNVQHSIRIDGALKGELTSGETVTIGSGGAVEGDVSARDLVVGGKVTGRLTATGRTLLEGTAALNGDLKTRRLVVEEGAVFNGSSDMSDAGESPAGFTPRKIKLFDEDSQE